MPLLDEVPGHRATARGARPVRVVADRAQVGRDLVRQHLLEAEAEQVGGVPAVRPGNHVAAEAGRPAGPPVAGRAAVGQSGPDGQVRLDVAGAVTVERAWPWSGELPLEDLAAAADGARGVAPMMNSDESGVVTSPRPAPICCSYDLAMPSLAVLGVTVRSASCASSGSGEQGRRGDGENEPACPGMASAGTCQRGEARHGAFLPGFAS